MYRVDRNNFYQENKNASIQTPDWVSNFLFELLNSRIQKEGVIFDPCVGEGSLLNPWKENGYQVLGVDIKKQGFKKTICQNFLTFKGVKKQKISLIIMNPPFNVDETTSSYIRENYSGRPLLPEVWLKKTIELFGKNVPIVMFTPYGFRLNQSRNSKRWECFFNGEYPEITSIISLPKDVFQNVLFHSEILIFNLPNLKRHYFNRIYVSKVDGTSDLNYFSPVSMYFRYENWTRKEMFEIMKEISETSLRYYLF